MVNYKKAINQFNYLEKKYFRDAKYQISKNQLYYLILNSKFVYKNFKYSECILNLILLILSICTILLCKFKRIKIANYFIVHRGSNGFYDFRSHYILKEFKLEKSINIIRCVSFFDSLKAYIKYPNVIFYLPIDYFNNSFLFKKSTLYKNYLMLHKKEIKNYTFIKKIFKFLKIKIFLSIDDQRVMQTFLKVSYDLQIKTFGYMHYKFSKFVVGIKYLCFDYFIVWSEYFKKKLIQVNKDYKNKNIRNNLLFIIDDHLDYNFTLDLLKKLNSEKKLNLFVKLKPQNNESKSEKLCKDNDIKYFKYQTLEEINRLIKFDYFIGNISTAILDATLYGAIPLKIRSSNIFADDLIKDRVVFEVSNYNDILKIIKNKRFSKKKNQIFNKVWGNKIYTESFMRNFFIKYIYE